MGWLWQWRCGGEVCGGSGGKFGGSSGGIGRRHHPPHLPHYHHCHCYRQHHHICPCPCPRLHPCQCQCHCHHYCHCHQPCHRHATATATTLPISTTTKKGQRLDEWAAVGSIGEDIGGRRWQPWFMCCLVSWCCGVNFFVWRGVHAILFIWDNSNSAHSRIAPVSMMVREVSVRLHLLALLSGPRTDQHPHLCVQQKGKKKRKLDSQENKGGTTERESLKIYPRGQYSKCNKGCANQHRTSERYSRGYERRRMVREQRDSRMNFLRCRHKRPRERPY
jgi:hypothetical protein